MITEKEERTTPFMPLTTTASLDELFLHSNDTPIIVFKHSSTCPISNAAYQEMGHVNRDVAIIVIQLARDVSKELERRTGIRHESPQVIILRHDAAVWNAAHWAIRADAVERAFVENA